MKTNIKMSVTLLCLSAVVQSPNALAVPMTIAGTNVNFTFDTALTGLFGAPVVSGDSFYFTPTNFMADSFNGAGIDSTSATFNVAVTANPGYLISGVQFSEDGDYYKLGGGSAVAVGGKLIVRDLYAPFVPTISSIAATAPLNVTTSFETFETTNWSAMSNVATPAAWGPVSGVNVTLQNILLANTSIPGGAAFIDKKLAGLTITGSSPSPVPESNLYTMLLAGLGLVGFITRRRKAVIWAMA